MDESAARALRFAAAQLVFVAGLLHLGLGVVNWVRWLSVGFLVPRDLRWPLFVLSGLVVLGGLVAAGRAADRRPYYAAGVVAMLGYAVGYFGWHLSGHRPLLLLGPASARETVSVAWFVDHLFAGPVETVTLFAEFLAIAALLALLLLE